MPKKNNGTDFLKMMASGESEPEKQHKQATGAQRSDAQSSNAQETSQARTESHEVFLRVQSKSSRKKPATFSMSPKRHDELVELAEYYNARSYSAMIEAMIEANYDAMQREKSAKH